MSYPDFTATSLTGTYTLPAGYPPAARRVATGYAASTMTVTVQGASDSTETPYPMVQTASFNGAGPYYGNLATVRGVTQSPPVVAPVAPGSASPLGDYESPYTWYDDPTTHARVPISAGSYRRGLFTGTSISVTFDLTQLQAFGAATADYPYYAISIDGGAFTRGLVPTSGSTSVSVSVASGLASGSHSYVLMQEYWAGAGRYTNNAYSAMRVLALTPSGGSVSQPATVQPKTMLLYGDSLSEGFNALAIWPAGTPPGSASASYVQVLAHNLSCELGVIANAGQGWLNPVDVPGLVTSWPNYISGLSRLTAGALTPAPDYLVVEMGTNDSGFTDAAVRTAVTATMTAMRAAAPLATLVILLPFTTQTKWAAITNGFNDFVSGGGTNCFLVNSDVQPGIIITLPGMSLDGIHYTVAGNIAVEPPVESAICRALGLTSLAWKVKVTNAGLGGYPQFFEVDDGGGIGFYATDNVPGNYTMTPYNIALDALYTPAWPDVTTALQWTVSHKYAIKEQRDQLLVGYPFSSPATALTPATTVATHIDPSRVMSGTVIPTPTLGTARELRVYTLWDVANNVAIGEPTYCNVPDRRTVALGNQLAGLRQDEMELTTAPIWQDTVGVNADQTFTMPVTVNTQGEIDLVRTSDLAIVARASMTNQFPREFFFYPGDTTMLNGTLAYGSDFEEVTFPPYASSVVGLAYLTKAAQTDVYTAAEIDAAYVNARLIAYGLAQAVQGTGIGGLPFGWGQRFDGIGPSTAYYRTGTEAWGAWYMFTACNRIPSSYWTGAYAAWKTAILAGATTVLNWVYSQDPGSGMVRFGSGRTDPATGIFDPTYQFTFYSMEHQADTLFLYLRAAADLGGSWASRATTLAAAILAHFWDNTNGRLYQSVDASLVPDGVAVLDCYSWGGKALLAMGESAKAIRAMGRADAYYSWVSQGPNGQTARAYTSFAAADGVTDPAPSVWVEGSSGIWATKKALGIFTATDQQRYLTASVLQQFDGSFRNFQVDGGLGGTQNLRSGQASAWYTIASDPSLWWPESLI